MNHSIETKHQIGKIIVISCLRMRNSRFTTYLAVSAIKWMIIINSIVMALCTSTFVFIILCIRIGEDEKKKHILRHGRKKQRAVSVIHRNGVLDRR